jgi:hypothetical protein
MPAAVRVWRVAVSIKGELLDVFGGRVTAAANDDLFGGGDQLSVVPLHAAGSPTRQ